MTDNEGTLSSGTAVGRAALVVNDLDRVVGFYRDVVGLAVQHREGERATLGAGGDPLLELTADPDAPERPRRSAGLFHTAFRVPSRAALGDAVERIEDRWELTGASDHHVSEALYLDDPEGNGVELYTDRPRGMWPHDESGHVRMATLPLDLVPLREAAGGERRAPDGTTVGHVHLEVSSLVEAERFYVDTLGLAVRQRFGADALFLAIGDYHHHLGVNVWNGRSEPPAGRGLRSWELRLPSGVDAVHERLLETGSDPALVDGGIEVRDPDGIRLRLRPTED